MKRKILTLLSVSVLIAILLNVREIHSNVAGSPEGYSGSPSDGQDCTSCHDDLSTIAQPGMITSDIPVNGYLPDSTYTIIAKVEKTGVTKFGFQVSPQSTSGALLGTLIVDNTTQLNGNGKYITHVASSTAGSGTKSWSFQWKAPKPSNGKVIFYGAFNASDNNSQKSGDQIYTSKLEVKDTAKVSGIDELVNNNSQISLYPNPSEGEFFVDIITTHGGTYDMRIFNITGQLLQSEVLKIPSGKTIKHITLDGNYNGILFLHLISNKVIMRKPVMVVN